MPTPPGTTTDAQHEFYYPHAVLDNFAAASSSCNWHQRFFLNTTFCTRDKCPIFLYIGGEGPLSVRSVGPGLFMHELAQQHGAAVVSLEHRYYGTSWPTVDMSTQNLKKYLSSAQALADLANFQAWFGPNGGSNQYIPQYQLGASEWVAFGGSYPGNLAAWVKLKYPQSFVGTVASSAPLFALKDWPGYMEVVSNSLKHFGKSSCFSAVRQSAERVMEYVQQEDFTTLNNLWDTCAPGLSSDSKKNGDLGTFLSNLQGFFQELVQYNRDRPLAPTVQSTCDRLLENPDTTFQVFVNLTKNSIQGACTEISTQDVYDNLNNVTLTGSSSSAMRPWIFQTCNEFGYFQVVGTDITLDAFASMADWLNLQSFTDICDQVFAMNQVPPRTKWSNTQYGTPNTIAAVNVTFPSGSLDPWHVLGVTNTSHPWTPLDGKTSTRNIGIFADELAVEIPFTSHCQDMYSNDFNIPEIKWAHEVIRTRVSHYLSSYISPPPLPPSPPPTPFSPTPSQPPVDPTPSGSSVTPSSGSGSGGGGNDGNKSNMTLPIVVAALCGICAGALGVVIMSVVQRRRRKGGSRLPSQSMSRINNYDTDYQVMGGGDTYEDI